MVRLSPPITLKLSRGELLAWDQSRMGLCVVAGTAWITQHGDPDDHFLRAFRATVGQTPYQYLLCRRIDLARQMLHRSKLPIAGVGRAVGFGSASHFAAMFRQHVGVTPGEWRHARAH